MNTLLSIDQYKYIKSKNKVKCDPFNSYRGWLL